MKKLKIIFVISLFFSLSILMPAVLPAVLEEQLEEKIGTLESILKEESRHIEELSAKFSGLLEEEKEKSAVKLKEKENIIQSLESQIKNYSEKTESSKDKAARVESLSGQMRDKDGQIKNLNLQLSEKEQTIRKLESDLENYASKINNVSQQDEEARGLSDQLKTKDNQINDLRAELSQKEDSFKNVQSELDEVLARESALKKEFQELEDNRVFLNTYGSSEEYEIKSKELAGKLEEGNAAVQELQRTLEEKQVEWYTERSSLRQELKLKDEEIDKLKNIVKNTIERIERLPITNFSSQSSQ